MRSVHITDKLLAVVVVLTLMVSAFGLVFIASQTDGEQDQISPIEQQYGDSLVSDNLSDPDVAAAFDFVVDSGEYTAAELMIMPMAIFVPFLAGIAVGLLVVWIAGIFAGNDGGKNPSTADAEQLRAELRQLRAELIQSNWQNVSNLFTKLAYNDAQILAFTEAYFDLQAETAAAELWTENGTFVGDRMLTTSTWIDNMAIYKYNVQSAINQFALAVGDQRSIFGDPSKTATYGSMRIGWTFGNDTFGMDDTTGDVWMAITDTVTPTQFSNRVYIDVVTYGDILTNTNYLYVFGGPATITNAATGVSYYLGEGINDIYTLGMASGWYTLETGRTYAGNFLPSSSIDGLATSAGMALYSNGNVALATTYEGSYTVIVDGVSNVASDITLSVRYPDVNGTTQAATQDVGMILESYQAIVDSLNHSAISAVDAAQTAWLIYDALGESSALIKPSSILAAMQTNTSITTDQAAAIYAAAMKQLAIYGDKVNPNDIKISRESLDLVVHGDIYYRGTIIAKDAIYTPIVYMEDTRLSVGRHDWNNQGLAMIWAMDVPSLASWDGQTWQYEIIELSEGYTLQTYDIVHSGVQVSSINLTVASMEYLGLMDFGLSDFAPSWEFKDDPATLYLMLLIITWMGIICYIATRIGGRVGAIMLLITIVGGALALLIVSGILQQWIDSLVDSIIGWW